MCMLDTAASVAIMLFTYAGLMIMVLKPTPKLFETRALQENCSLKELCDKYHAIHKEVYDRFDISFDMFGRTSTPQHTQVSQAIFDKLWENKCLKEDNIMQRLYCDTCKTFLSDGCVEGSCPIEGCHPRAQLKDPRCKVCQTTPRICDPDLRFIELPLRTRMEKKLVDHIKRTSAPGSWTNNATGKWLWEGLTQRCITRDLDWGVPRRHEIYEDKVFYAWLDSPIGYVSITSCYTSEWDKWWKNPENVELCQFMGKQHLPFHSVMFPCAQHGTGENWTVVNKISATQSLGYYDSGKFSKSEGVGVFGDDVKDTNVPVDVWRYYLLSIRPEVYNTLFEWKGLQRANNMLLRSLGNFVNRVLSFIAEPEPSGYGSVIPDAPGAALHRDTKLLGEKVGRFVGVYVKAMEKVQLKHGLRTAMDILGQGNKYLKGYEFSRVYKSNKYYKNRCSCAVLTRTAAGLVQLLARLLEPFMPSFSREVFKQLNLPPDFSLCDERGEVLQASRPWEILPLSHRIGTPQPLFKELTAKQMWRYEEKFSGSLSERRDRDAGSTRQTRRRRSMPEEAATQPHRDAVALIRVMGAAS